MNYQCDQARLSAEEIAEIYRNMEARGLSHVYCQACAGEMKPEHARKSASTGLIMCRPCYMCNETDATQDEIERAARRDIPGYLASFQLPLRFRLYTSSKLHNPSPASKCRILHLTSKPHLV